MFQRPGMARSPRALYHFPLFSSPNILFPGFVPHLHNHYHFLLGVKSCLKQAVLPPIIGTHLDLTCGIGTLPTPSCSTGDRFKLPVKGTVPLFICSPEMALAPSPLILAQREAPILLTMSGPPAPPPLFALRYGSQYNFLGASSVAYIMSLVAF